MIRAGDQLHVLVRDEVRRAVEDLIERWQAGPIGPGTRRQPERSGAAPALLVVAVGAPPTATRRGRTTVRGHEVLDTLRMRRDEPGALVLLADGRYAVTGGEVRDRAARRARRVGAAAAAARGRRGADVAADRRAARSAGGRGHSLGSRPQP